MKIKEEITLCLFADDRIIYIDNPMKSIIKLLEFISELIKDTM